LFIQLLFLYIWVCLFFGHSLFRLVLLPLSYSEMVQAQAEKPLKRGSAERNRRVSSPCGFQTGSPPGQHKGTCLACTAFLLSPPLLLEPSACVSLVIVQVSPFSGRRYRTQKNLFGRTRATVNKIRLSFLSEFRRV
jgi:hypothetical protein